MIKIYFLFFKYCADVKNCDSFSGYIYIYIYILVANPLDARDN